jgi:diguanylate cyclase (GGDEF)-like protein
MHQAIFGSIRGRILFAFLIMSVITGTLGIFAIHDLRWEGSLVSKTFDKSLMSINYARAASADFNAIQAAFARRLFAQDREARDHLDAKIEELEKNLDDDLSIAMERAQSERASKAGARVQKAVAAWTAQRKGIVDGTPPKDVWSTLDHYADVAAAQIELLINYTAGDGFSNRQAANSAVETNMRVDLLVTLGAVLISFLIASVLSRMILSPIDMASEVARKIAGGKLDVTVPTGGAGELAALLAAMELMRGNIKLSIQSEVSQRRSAQTRLADALESSCEGIVVVDAASKIVLANSQVATFLAGRLGRLKAGDPASGLMLLLKTELGGETRTPAGCCAARDVQGADGRWFRISQNATQEGGEIIVFSDITAFKNQEAAIKATNEQFDVALANMSQGLCLYDAGQRIQVVNRRFCEIFRLPSGKIEAGMSLDEVIDLSIAAGNFSSRTDPRVVAAKMRIEGGVPVKSILDVPGDRLVAVAHQPLVEGGWVETYEDVTDRLQSEAKIVYMARHDTLTGLANRTLFTERVEQALGQTGRGDGFAVFCLDLDHFKAINETWGHPLGDALLRAVAERLSSCIREVDTVARLGGDEFAILQVGLKGPDDATILARRIVETIKLPFEIEGHRVTIGVSIGISMAPGDGTSFGKLLKNADVALYKAKSDGRDTWRFFEMEMDARLQARRALEADLREALAQNAFELYYQPLFDFKRNRIGSFEALLRWNHPKRGMVSPAEFIPLAEEIGLITQLGEWALRTACNQANLWSDGVRVAVNVSPAQFKSGKLAAAVVDALAKSGLVPNRLELEITESVILANSETTLATLNQIRGLGVKIAMDDFGTGYSSLSYLRSFPFDKVKIDQSFIRDLDSKADSSVIVGAIIGLCKSLGMRVTAEGVETQAQLDFLQWQGCNEAQGYYFSKPVPSAHVERVIAKWAGGSDLFAKSESERLAG